MNTNTHTCDDPSRCPYGAMRCSASATANTDASVWLSPTASNDADKSARD